MLNLEWDRGTRLLTIIYGFCFVVVHTVFPFGDVSVYRYNDVVKSSSDGINSTAFRKNGSFVSI